MKKGKLRGKIFWIALVSALVGAMLGGIVTLALAGTEVNHGSVYDYAIISVTQTGTDEITVKVQARYCPYCNPNSASNPGCPEFTHGYPPPNYPYNYWCGGLVDGRYIAIRIKDGTGNVLGTQKLVCNPTNWPINIVFSKDFVFRGVSLAPGSTVIAEADVYCSWCGHWYPSPASLEITAGLGLDVDVTPKPGSCYIGEPIEFEVTVTNIDTGTGLTARDVKLTIEPPIEIEMESPTSYSLGDLAPGGSKSHAFKAKAKAAGINIETVVRAEGKTTLGLIAGSGSCYISIHDPEAPEPDWSFAIITDLHIGYGSEIGDWDGDGKNVEIDYGAVTWNDSAPLPQEHNYGITDKLANAIETIITGKNYYNIKFVVVLGDISDTAERSEFFKARELLNRLNDHGIPYIPLMGNHDNWPYTQDIGKHHWWEPSDRMGTVDDRDHYADIAEYAKGDEFFREVFWGESNNTNVGLIKSLFGDSWEYMYEQPIRVRGRPGEGCRYKFKERESGGNKFYDRSEKELVSREHDFYLHNYGFVYDGIPFVCLDLAPRLGEDLDPMDGNAIPGALKGAFATSHPETVAFARMYTDDHESETKTAVIFSHYELGLMGMWNYIRGDYDTVYNFAGHVHYNDDSCEWWEWTNDFSYQITTEDVAGIKLHPLKKHNGEVIRIVQVKAGQIDYSTTLKPMKEVEIKRSFPDFAYTFASYPEPNKEIIFIAYYTTYHGFSTSFDWDFGDGNFGSGSPVTHTYSQEGDYNVTLTVTAKNLITGEETTQTVSEVVYVRTKHIIYPLPPNLAATSLLTEENLSQVPKNTYEPALITKEASEETLIGALGVHFEEADEDIDLSGMVADIDLEEAKSVLYMPSWPAEIEQYKTLFIPSTGVGTVYICLDATSLDEVTLENADLFINVGETKGAMTVTTTFYNGKEYYLVSGVTGTGGGELTNQPPVADAGPDQTVYVTPPATTALVTLDGSGSHDADGDPLTYTWTWNGNIAYGVNPAVELPLGTTTITLVVNDGKVDSAPDTVNISVIRRTTPTPRGPGAPGAPPVRYQLTTNSTTGGSIVKPGEGTFTYAKGTVVALVAKPDEGYRFVNWTGDVGTIGNVTAATTTITMNDNYSITANFVARYNLIISGTAGGSVTTPGEGRFTYDKGTVVNLAATPDAGYRFVNWTGNVTTVANVNAASTTITMNGNYSIQANFAAVYNLTVSSTAGGTVTTPGMGTFIRDVGTVVNLVATPDKGYRFVNWTGDVGTIGNVNAASTTITMNGDYSIAANFERTTNWSLIGGIIAAVVVAGLAVLLLRRKKAAPTKEH